MSMTPPICFYHSSDLDGLCSGAIMARAMPDAEMRGYDYGQPFPWADVEGRDVHMSDVSLQPGEDMARLATVAKSLTWVDHHKSAIDDAATRGLSGLPGLRRIGDAACELCWEFYFGGKKPEPLGVHLLGRYDVWAWRDVPGALEYQFGMRIAEDTRNVRGETWGEVVLYEGQDSFFRTNRTDARFNAFWHS